MKRLEMIAKAIPPYTYIADIGCDHGYLIQLAIDHYHVKKAFAVDNKELPLESAKQHLKDYQNITFSLSDGISFVPEDVEVIILAGMGGMLICDILSNHFEKLKNVQRIIVEANRNQEKVRKLLCEHGFIICKEMILFEDDIDYEIIVFEHGIEPYQEIDYLFGPILRMECSPEFQKKWNKKLKIFQKISTSKAKEKVKLILSVLNSSERK